MRILFLGPADSPTLAYLRSAEGEVVATQKPLTSATFRSEVGRPDFLVSHSYRHIVPGEVLADFPRRAVNLHIALLPWNRGAYPNVWSFAEGTPKGVTIHYMDEGVDTGDIIVQREVRFAEGETLKTSYEKLQSEIVALFREHWPRIRTGRCPATKQRGPGSFHRAADLERLSDLMPSGWDTPVSSFDDCAAESQLSRDFWEKHAAEIPTLTPDAR